MVILPLMNSNINNDIQYLTVREVARLVSRSERWVRLQVANGVITPHRIKSSRGKHWGYTAHEVTALRHYIETRGKV